MIATRKKTRKGRKKQGARVQQRTTTKRKGFPTDAESIVLRQVSAEKEGARVLRLQDGDGFYGDFEVASAQWDAPYRVEIRSLGEPLNTCSCQDHRMNGLGTCKHVERVLQFVAHRRKRRYQAAAKEGPPAYEIFFDERQHPPRLTMLRPAVPTLAIEKRLAPLFGSDGVLLGTPGEVWPTLEKEIGTLPARHRSAVRLSGHCEYWLERERYATALRHLRSSFENDVAAGKRSDNPVNLPLYPYQKQGMKHLAFHGRALLADEMGLGKTVQAIAAAELMGQLGQVRRVLVVSPASLKAEWEDQIMQFTGIQATPVYGPRNARLRTYAEEHPFILCNYEQIRVDVDDINRLLVPDLVILDEAQRIKNWPTKTAKTIKRLRSPHAFVLTGTPLENRIEELYSLVEFVDPHVFGSLFRFQREYIEVDADNGTRPKNLDRLHRVVSRVMLRRRKSDIDDALPERTDKNFFVPMTREQRARYGEFEYEVAKLVAIMKRRPLRKEEADRLQLNLACMRMTCDTPYILDAECRDCPKLNELEDILDEVLDDDTAKVIIFSEWVRMLDLVKERLENKKVQYAEHTGKVPQKERRRQIGTFKKDPACRVFLSSESGGTGLNLQAANIVINLDLPWNPAKLEQRIARAWRKHQKRSVRVINLVAEASIEQSMLDKLAYKSALADSVLDGAEFKASLRTQTGRQAFAERVGSLLGGEPVTPSPDGGQRRDKPVAEGLKDMLTSRFADSIIGIERNGATGGSVVVARPGSNVDALRNAAKAASGDQAVVITPEIKALLLQLQKIGIVTITPEVTALHMADGYTPFTEEAAKPAAPSLDYGRARKIWEASAAELKAATALRDIGLYDQAAPHVSDVLEAGHTAIAALHGCTPDELGDRALPRHQALLTRIAAARDRTGEREVVVTEGLRLAEESREVLYPE